MAQESPAPTLGGGSEDPRPGYRRLRDECPVLRSGASVVVSRYEDVLWALRHPEVFASEDAVSIGNERPLIPLQVDPPEHVKYRKLLDPVFSRKRMEVLEPRVRRLAAQRVAAVAGRGECDFHKEVSEPLPSTIFLELLGLPLERLPYFLELKDGIIRPGADATAETREAVGRRIYALFEEALDARAAEPRDDLLSWMLGEEVEGQRLSREQILDICYLLLLAGLDTVTASLDCFVAYLAQHPERRRMAAGRPELLDGAIEELLRSETPVVAVVRVLARDATLAGVELKAGDRAMLLLGAADGDERAFEDPDRVDFERRPNRHLAFGGGPHRCLGSHLARMELRAVLDEFHARIPDYELAPGAQLDYSGGIRQLAELPLVWKPGG